MKALENITIHWDGSARNSDGSVVQFNYGDDGFDPMRIENQYWTVGTTDRKVGTDLKQYGRPSIPP